MLAIYSLNSPQCLFLLKRLSCSKLLPLHDGYVLKQVRWLAGLGSVLPGRAHRTSWSILWLVDHLEREKKSYCRYLHIDASLAARTVEACEESRAS